jgi:hypothetical protein
MVTSLSANRDFQAKCHGVSPSAHSSQSFSEQCDQCQATVLPHFATSGDKHIGQEADAWGVAVTLSPVSLIA